MAPPPQLCTRTSVSPDKDDGTPSPSSKTSPKQRGQATSSSSPGCSTTPRRTKRCTPRPGTLQQVHNILCVCVSLYSGGRRGTPLPHHAPGHGGTADIDSKQYECKAAICKPPPGSHRLSSLSSLHHIDPYGTLLLLLLLLLLPFFSEETQSKQKSGFGWQPNNAFFIQVPSFCFTLRHLLLFLYFLVYHIALHSPCIYLFTHQPPIPHKIARTHRTHALTH